MYNMKKISYHLIGKFSNNYLIRLKLNNTNLISFNKKGLAFLLI